MKIIALCALLIQLMPAAKCSSVPLGKQDESRTAVNSIQNNRQWHAGTYRGLTAGKSTLAEALRFLGEPKRQDRPPDQTPEEPNPEVWYIYDDAGEFPGELTVVIEERTETVLRIDLNPDNVSKEDAVKHFGPDYILTRYDFDDCLGSEESAPVFESPNGALLEVEYRHRGIAMLVNDSGKVQTISYVSKPIGAPESKCNRSKRDRPTDMSVKQ